MARCRLSLRSSDQGPGVCFQGILVNSDGSQDASHRSVVGGSSCQEREDTAKIVQLSSKPRWFVVEVLVKLHRRGHKDGESHLASIKTPAEFEQGGRASRAVPHLLEEKLVEGVGGNVSRVHRAHVESLREVATDADVLEACEPRELREGEKGQRIVFAEIDHAKTRKIREAACEVAHVVELVEASERQKVQVRQPGHAPQRVESCVSKGTASARTVASVEWESRGGGAGHSLEGGAENREFNGEAPDAREVEGRQVGKGLKEARQGVDRDELLAREAQAPEVRESRKDREGRGRALRRLAEQVGGAERELEVCQRRQVGQLGEGLLESAFLQRGTRKSLC